MVLLEVVIIDKECYFEDSPNNLLISRLGQRLRFSELPAREWRARMEMAVSLSV